MELKFLEPEWKDYSFAKIEYGNYWIETQITVTRCCRIKVREKESINYLVDWCAGEHLIAILPLIKCVLMLIDDEKDLTDLPHPEIRPYYNDNIFSEWLLRLIVDREREDMHVIYTHCKDNLDRFSLKFNETKRPL